jgi:hypothetical protein
MTTEEIVREELILAPACHESIIDAVREACLEHLQHSVRRGRYHIPAAEIVGAILQCELIPFTLPSLTFHGLE